MILFFDTETTGIPKNYQAPITELENWPRVIQLAWALADLSGEIINVKEYLITPDCWEVPKEPFWIDHGFTTERNKKEGVWMRQALTEFISDLEKAEFLVAHNIAFDHKVLAAEFIRYKMSGKVIPKICTMESTIDFCAIPFSGERNWLSKKEKRFKWPKLIELHQKLFGREFGDVHSAGGDVRALKDCFFELIKLGIIKLEKNDDRKNTGVQPEVENGG